MQYAFCPIKMECIMLDANSAKEKAEKLREKWLGLGAKRRLLAIDSIRAALKAMNEPERSRALTSLNVVRKRYGEIELRNDEDNPYYGPLNKQLIHLENSGRRVFVPFIVWLRYYYSDLAAAFLDTVFESNGWDFPPLMTEEAWPQRPLVAPSYEKLSNLSLSVNLAASRNKSAETQAQLLRQAVPNRAAEDFKTMIDSQSSGAWCLTAGPGAGKSVLMASLADDLADAGLCVPYYFDWSQDARFAESRRELFTYVAGVVRSAFSIPSNEIGELTPTSLTFFEFLKLLSDRKRITKEHPLIILIDGVDEMGRGFQYGDPNPLGIPEVLPDGIFIAYSIRRQKTDESWAWQPPKSHNRLHMDANNPALKDALMEFIDRAIEGKDYLRDFLEGQPGKSFAEKKGEFCRELIQAAAQNFMFVRCVLFDPSYWTGDALRKIRSTKNLDEYYASHLRRMTNGEMYGLNARAAFCFSFTAELSRFAFLEMLKSADTPDAFAKASELLDQWYDQGLLISLQQEGETWFRPYHRTFREFLAKETKLNGEKEFFRPLADAITRKEIDDDLILDFLPDTLRCKTEWVNLTLSLLVRANMPNRLGKFLVSLQMWNLAAAGYDGIRVVFECLKLVRANGRSYQVHRSNMEKCARELIAWTAQKQIYDKNGEALSISQVSEISEASRVGIANRDSTSHLNFSQVLFEVRSAI